MTRLPEHLLSTDMLWNYAFQNPDTVMASIEHISDQFIEKWKHVLAQAKQEDGNYNLDASILVSREMADLLSILYDLFSNRYGNPVQAGQTLFSEYKKIMSSFLAPEYVPFHQQRSQIMLDDKADPEMLCIDAIFGLMNRCIYALGYLSGPVTPYHSSNIEIDQSVFMEPYNLHWHGLASPLMEFQIAEHAEQLKQFTFGKSGISLWGALTFFYAANVVAVTRHSKLENKLQADAEEARERGDNVSPAKPSFRSEMLLYQSYLILDRLQSESAIAKLKSELTNILAHIVSITLTDLKSHFEQMGAKAYTSETYGHVCLSFLLWTSRQMLQESPQQRKETDSYASQSIPLGATACAIYETTFGDGSPQLAQAAYLLTSCKIVSGGLDRVEGQQILLDYKETMQNSIALEAFWESDLRKSIDKAVDETPIIEA